MNVRHRVEVLKKVRLHGLKVISSRRGCLGAISGICDLSKEILMGCKNFANCLKFPRAGVAVRYSLFCTSLFDFSGELRLSRMRFQPK